MQSAGKNCGKCKIRLKGELDVTPSDRKHFTEEELAQGYRLACRHTRRMTGVKSPWILQDEVGFFIQVGHGDSQQNLHAGTEASYDIAVDIGTRPHWHFSLLEKTSRSPVGSFATLNEQQRAFGRMLSFRTKNTGIL